MSRWLLLIFFFATYSASAQLYNFKTYSFDEGLTESHIEAICEDSRGNLWIGTWGGGLFRFDGYSFYSYLKEDGLSSNIVHAVFEDEAGRLWVGTEEGACVYDGKKFVVLKGLEKEAITTICQDGSKNLWLGTSLHGLYKFDGTHLSNISTARGLPDNSINCLYFDSYSNLWVGTGRGAGKFDSNGFYHPAPGLSSADVEGICEDDDKNIWFATAGHGLGRLDSQQRYFSFSSGSGLPSQEVFAVSSDGKGNLWLGTARGIVKYDGNVFDYYDTYTGQESKAVTCVYKDSSGDLWFGSLERGLSKLDSERFIHYGENDHLGRRVYAITQAVNRNMICGTSKGGITVFDGRNYSLSNNNEVDDDFAESTVQSLYYTPDSVLWVGTQESGAYRFSKSRYQRYTTQQGLVSNNIIGFTSDALGNIWIASADSGVSVLQPGHDSVQVIKNYHVDDGLASEKIRAISRDKIGTVWIGTEDRGVDKVIFSGSTATFTHVTQEEGLSSNVIHCIVMDSLGNTYVGTSKGLCIYDGDKFHYVSKANGLGSDNIYSLAIDDSNNVWTGTERGVDRISFKENFVIAAVRHFGTDDGFKGIEVYRNASWKDDRGNIWFGTVNGLVKYNPNEEVYAKLIPKIHITGMKLFFDDIENTPYADSTSAWYPIPTKLTLPYNENNLSFSFVGIYHRNPQAVRYKWILEGFNRDWSPAIAEREATFSNLPPGEYTFKVMAGNENNVWSEAPAAFEFQILPPIWEQWWVKPVAVLIIGLSIWGIFYVRLKRVKEKNRVIQEKLEMEKNILELEQEAARLQMNPHFIFNALNSIQGFIANNDAVQAKRHLVKFAQLMRLILENAREEFIPLKNEIGILDNYMELEKISNNNKFDFTIHVPDSINPENLEIPPMMLQPFVENAIVHGVKKKEGRGLVRIEFSIKDGLLVCEITDDGVGRKRSREMNKQSRPSHKSTGISVTTQRLEQLGKQRGLPTGIQFVDLEENGQSVGTKVIVSVPYEG